MISGIKKTNMQFLGLFVLGFQVIAWCMSTISYKSNMIWIGATFFSVLSAYTYTIVNRTETGETNRKQLRKLNLFLFMYSVVLLITFFRHNTIPEKLATVVFALIWIVALVCCCITSNVGLQKISLTNTFSYVKDHKCLIMLLAGVTIFSYEEFGLQFKWDGLLYYEAAQDLNLFSISSLAQYGHISQFYSVLVKTGILIWGDVGTALAINNTVLLMISISAFYGLIKFIVPEKTDATYALASAVYGCSPFLLGMVNYYSLDYYLICLFPVVIYYGIKRQWILHFLFAIFFVFTKETAIVVYALFCFGTLLYDIFSEKRNIKSTIVYVCSKPYYYYMTFLGITWFVIYKILGPWTAGVGGFELNANYIKSKLLVMNVLNFSWTLMLINIVGVMYVLLKYRLRIKYTHWIYVCLSIYFGFQLFSIVYNTINHARYIDSNILIIYLVAVVLILNCNKRFASRLMLLILSVLMFTSCYFTWDPVTKMTFKNVDIGATTMISTSDAIFGDSMIYNKQMLYMEEAISEIINEACKADCNIAMVSMDDSTYFFDGMQEVTGITDKSFVKRQFYCIDGHRYINKKENAKNIYIYSIRNNTEIRQLCEDDNKPIIYIYMDSLGDGYRNLIKETCDVIDEFDICKKGWTLKAITFEMK